MFKKIFLRFFVVFFMISMVFAGKDDPFNNAPFEDTGFGDFDFLKTSFNQLNFFDTWSHWSTFYFDIHYYNEATVYDTINYIDRVYDMIMEDFGWLYFSLPKRVDIYVYKDREEYAKKTGMSYWAGAHTELKEGAIYTYEQENLFENIIVHELTHMVFDAYMGYPRRMAISWLHEGVAVYEEKKILRKLWNIKYLKDLYKQGRAFSIKDLLKTHTGLQKTSERVSIWYFQAGLLVAYLRTLEPEGFRIFTENLKRYKNVAEALKITYPWDFRNLDDLEEGFKKWLERQGDVM